MVCFADVDQNGHIDKDEVGNLLEMVRKPTPTYKIRTLMSNLDTDKDGVLSPAEFSQVGLETTSVVLFCLISHRFHQKAACCYSLQIYSRYTLYCRHIHRIHADLQCSAVHANFFVTLLLVITGNIRNAHSTC